MLLEINSTIPLNIDAVRVVGWIIIFLITSLIAIIVWVTRAIITKVDDIADKQNIENIDREKIKGELGALIVSSGEIHRKLEGVPILSEKVVAVQETLTTMKSDIITIKNEHSDFTKRLSMIERQSAVNAEWIRLTEKQSKEK